MILLRGTVLGFKYLFLESVWLRCRVQRIGWWPSCGDYSNMTGQQFSILCDTMWVELQVLNSVVVNTIGCLVVSVLDYQSWGSGFKSRPGQKFGSRFLLHLRPLANPAMMSTLTTHCHWEDEDGEGEDWPPAIICWGYENEVANTSYPWLC